MPQRLGVIPDVRIAPRRRISDDRGSIFHMLKRTDPEFSEFGEIYFSRIYPGVVKAWHFHQRMTLNYFLVSGSVRLVLFDDRIDSPSRGVIQEIFLDEFEGRLVVIPPNIWNGFKGLGSTSSLIANCASHPHQPEEMERRPFDAPEFCYDWGQRHG